jgi:DNA-binding transcriptional LysR family regulator
MNVTFRQLRAFAAVASSGSFTRAAESLHVSQSAVSILIRELEADLGVRLFDRTTRRVEITDAGSEFRASADKLIADLEHAVRHTHELVERKRGRVTVAAPPLLATALLPRTISVFQREFPGVRVSLVDVATDQIVSRVKSGEVDLGVGTFEADEDGLTRTVLTKDTLMLFCGSADQFALRRRRPRWSDLKGAPLITLTRESGIRTLVEYGYATAHLTVNPEFEVALITTALALVELGLGVSVLPTYALASSSPRRIVARPLSEPPITREITVIWRRGRSLAPAADEFLQRLRHHAKAPHLRVD